jgi:hypothetical protein
MFRISDQKHIITKSHIHTIHINIQDAAEHSNTQVKAFEEKIVLLKNKITTSKDTKYHRY